MLETLSAFCHVKKPSLSLMKSSPCRSTVSFPNGSGVRRAQYSACFLRKPERLPIRELVIRLNECVSFIDGVYVLVLFYYIQDKKSRERKHNTHPRTHIHTTQTSTIPHSTYPKPPHHLPSKFPTQSVKNTYSKPYSLPPIFLFK